MQLFLSVTLEGTNLMKKRFSCSSEAEKTVSVTGEFSKSKMTSAAIDVNQGITGQKTATIRNYTTQPRLSMFWNFH